MRVQGGLAAVHVAHPALEVDVGLVDVLTAVEITPVVAAALGGEALLNEADGHVEEDVEVRAR